MEHEERPDAFNIVRIAFYNKENFNYTLKIIMEECDALPVHRNEVSMAAATTNLKHEKICCFSNLLGTFLSKLNITF